MKMSEVFELPLDEKYTRTLWKSDTEAIELAVNNNDALVEALGNLIKGRRTCSPDMFFELINEAESLLAKIKGESK